MQIGNFIPAIIAFTLFAAAVMLYLNFRRRHLASANEQSSDDRLAEAMEQIDPHAHETVELETLEAARQQVNELGYLEEFDRYIDDLRQQRGNNDITLGEVTSFFVNIYKQLD